MSRDTSAAGVFGIAGALIGVAFGQWLEDRRRSRGKLRREVRAWSGGTTGTISESRVFEVRFFKDRDVNISLWDAEVECYRGGELIGSMISQPAGHRGKSGADRLRVSQVGVRGDGDRSRGPDARHPQSLRPDGIRGHDDT
jgi:hypothetical protein